MKILPHRQWVRWLSILFALLLTFGCGSQPQSENVATVPGYDVTLESQGFKARDGTEVQVESGNFKVPLNRSSPSSDRVQLAFIRFKSTNPKPGAPIVYLAGGPGGSGINRARNDRFSLFMALREVADVIAFDQRATGISSPLEHEDCEQSRERPLDRPLDHATYSALSLEVASECAAYWRDQGIDLAAYNTRESAADLEDLRKVLGVEKISLWSISYGSHLALATLRYYPNSIDRIILAGVEGPDHTLKLPSFTESQFEKLETMIQADPEASQNYPEFRDTVIRMLERLDNQPVTVEFLPEDGQAPTRIQVGRPELERLSIAMLRDPSTMVALPALYQRLAAGDFSSIGNSPEIHFEFEAMAEAMDAASGASDPRIRRFEQEARETLFGGGAILANAKMASALQISDLGDDFRAPLSASHHALFISGTLDGRTPQSNAEEVAAGFSNGVHLVIENGGHGNDLFLSSPVILKQMLKFMKGEPLQTSRISLPPPSFAKVRQITTLAPSIGRTLLGEYKRENGDLWRVISLGTYRTLGKSGEVLAENMRIQVRIGHNGYTLAAVSSNTFFIDLPGWEQRNFIFTQDQAGEVQHLEFTTSTGNLERAMKIINDK